MSFKTAAFVVGALASAVRAHGTVSGIVADGVYYGGYSLNYYYAKQNGQAVPDVVGWSAENLDNGFIDGTGYASADIICHKNAAPGKAVATVKAGGKVDFQWTVWPDSHKGPAITYVANCNGDCTTVDKTKLEFVKIDAGGLDTTTQKWASEDMIANNNTWTTTVPSNLAPGNYVFRHELIALHGAGSTNGAQNYPQCFNIAVTGSGTESPAGTLGTALYKNTDAGILINIYQTLTSYTIPGPALFGSSSGGSGSSSPANSAASSVAAPTSTKAASTPVATGVAETTAPATPTLTKVATTTAAAPTATSTSGSSPSSPSTPLPEGFTVDDLLEWVSYLLRTAAKTTNLTRRHARDIVLN